jgi:hypothetical protein
MKGSRRGQKGSGPRADMIDWRRVTIANKNGRVIANLAIELKITMICAHVCCSSNIGYLGVDEVS